MAARFLAVYLALLAIVTIAVAVRQEEVGVSGKSRRTSGFRVQMKQRRGTHRKAADAQQAGGDVAATVECTVVLPADAAGPVTCVAAHYASAARRRRPLPLQWPVLGELLALHPLDGCSRVRDMRVIEDGGGARAGDMPDSMHPENADPSAAMAAGEAEAAEEEMGRPLRGAVEAALESASERGALPLLALVRRGGCDFATKVRRVQALNGAVARERREATRLERRRLTRAGKPVPKHLGEGDEDERFAGIVVVDDMANEHVSGVAGELSLMPPGLGDDASVFLPLVMVPYSNGTALRELLRAETEGLLDSAPIFSMEFKAGTASLKR